MSFGENLQYYRAENSMTQEQLAEQLAVSRQSVSKWESDASFPEMDKLLALCDLFHCTLDTLLRGDAKASRQEDTAGYDRHMNRFAKMIAVGVSLCICGFIAGGLLEALLGSDRWSGAVMLLFVLAAVVLFIIGSIQHNDFCTHNTIIEPFYSEQALFEWRQRFPVFMAVGTALCIAGVILISLADGMASDRFAAAGAVIGSPESEAARDIFAAIGAQEEFLTALGLLPVAVGAGLLTYGGLQNSKYHVERYNKERQAEKNPRNKKIGNISAVIMLAATGVFLVYWFIWPLMDGEPQGIGVGAGVIYGLAGLACAIVNILFKKDE